MNLIKLRQGIDRLFDRMKANLSQLSFENCNENYVTLIAKTFLWDLKTFLILKCVLLFLKYVASFWGIQK